MRGVLVIDNTARGMGKGGTRMSTTVSVGEVARLARNMTWKWAGVDLFYGGAKAGIWADPTAASKEDGAARIRPRAAQRGPRGVRLRSRRRDHREATPRSCSTRSAAAAARWAPPTRSAGCPYDQLGVTGHGVAESADAAAQALGLSTGSLSVSIQGFGAVGAATAKRLDELGATVVAVSTSQGGMHNPDGLDVASC